MEKPTARDDALIISSTWCQLQVIINFIVLAKQTSSTKRCQRPSQAEGKAASWHLSPIEFYPLIYSSYIPLVSPVCRPAQTEQTQTYMKSYKLMCWGFFLSCLTYRTSITHIWNGFCCAKFGDKIVSLLLSSTEKKRTRIKCISIKWLERINYTNVRGRSTYHNMALKNVERSRRYKLETK